MNEQKEQAASLTNLDMQTLVEKRDLILKNWRVAKAPEKKERIREALDRLIEEIVQERENHRDIEGD